MNCPRPNYPFFYQHKKALGASCPDDKSRAAKSDVTQDKSTGSFLRPQTRIYYENICAIKRSLDVSGGFKGELVNNKAIEKANRRWVRRKMITRDTSET